MQTTVGPANAHAESVETLETEPGREMEVSPGGAPTIIHWGLQQEGGAIQIWEPTRDVIIAEAFGWTVLWMIGAVVFRLPFPHAYGLFFALTAVGLIGPLCIPRIRWARLQKRPYRIIALKSGLSIVNGQNDQFMGWDQIQRMERAGFTGALELAGFTRALELSSTVHCKMMVVHLAGFSTGDIRELTATIARTAGLAQQGLHSRLYLPAPACQLQAAPDHRLQAYNGEGETE